MSIRNRAAAVACGLALAATALAPAAAFADGTTDGSTGTTEVTITAAKKTDDQGGQTDEDQLSFEVPTVIAFAAKADGTLVGPSASATKIVNRSVFGIHVTDMAVAATDGWNLVADASAGTQDNAISFELNGVRAAASTDLSADAGWEMTYAGSAGDSVEIASTGSIARVTKDLETAQRAATITWTLAAGGAR